MTEAVTALVFDAREAAAGAAQFDAAGKRIIDSNAAVVTATTRTQAAIDNMDRALARVQRQIDPVAAAQQRMVAQTTLLDRALQRGKIAAEEHARSVALVQQRYEASVQAAQRATASLNGIVAAHDNAARGTGRFGQAMGQAGFQVQDFATQVTMGQNALMAFGTQFAQFAGFFGATGAIAGAVVITGVLAAQLLGIGTAADTLAEAIRGVDENYRRVNDAAERRAKGLAGEAEAVTALTAEYTAMGLAAARAESLIVERRGAALDLESARMRQALEGSLSDSVRQRMNPRDAFNEAGEALGLAQPDKTLGALADALARVQTDAGATMQAMAEVAAEADRLAQAGGSGASSLMRLRNAALDLMPAAAQLDAAQRQVAVQTLAAAQAMGASDEVMRRYAERFGEVGAQILGAARALNTLRQRAVDNPMADMNAEITRLNQQMEALGQGGLAAYQRVLTGQERQAEITRLSTRAQEQFTAALIATQVPADEAARRAEEMGASFVAAATQQVDAAQRVTDRVRTLEAATRDAGRAARTTAAAYGQISTNSSGLLSLGASDNAAITEAQRALRGSAIDPAMVDRTASQAAAIEARALENRASAWRTSTDDIVRYSADLFADMTRNNERGWRGMLDTLVGSSKAAFARIAAEAVIRPAVTAVVGGDTKSASGGGGLLSNLGSLSSLAGLLGGKSSSLGRYFGGGVGDGANISAIGAGGDFAGKAASSLDIAAPASSGFSFSSLGINASSLGMAAAGFGVGSMIGGFTAGNSPNRQTNGQIGAAIGTAAGLALTPVLGPLGPLLGGALGGGLGGLIGPRRGFSGGDAILGSDASGLLTVDRTAGKNFDSEALGQQVQQQLEQVNATLRALGLRFGQGVFAAVGGGESGNPREIADALDHFGQRLLADNANVNRAIQGLGFEDAVQAAQWVQQVYEPMLRSADAGNAFANAIADLRKPFDDAIATAQKYGLATDALVEAQNRAHGAAVRANFRQVQDNDLSLVMREAQASGSRANVLRERRFAQNILAQRERDDLGEQLAARAVTGQEAIDVRARLERALAREADAVAREFEKLARDQRTAAEGLTARITRANAARGGNARDLQQADLYDFDTRARVEVDSLRDSLRELGLASNAVEAEVTRLIQAHALERNAIIEAYAERRRLVAQSLDDRLFAASNDNSTVDGALAAFDRAAQAERLDAAKAGIADLVQLERVLAAERGQIVQDFARQAREALTATGGSIRAFLTELRTGEAGGASPQDRLLAAQRQFGEDLALARGGDAEALSRITGTASSLLSASRDMNASGPEYQAMLRMVETSLAALPATRSYDAMILEELRKLGGAVDVEVDLQVIRAITETLNALPDADRARLVQAQTVLRSVKERIGRFLAPGEVSRLVEAELVLRDVQQQIGRDLTAAERAGLLSSDTVLRQIEQRLGADLTTAQRASLVQGGAVDRLIAQAIGRDLTAAERAGLVQGASVIRSVEQRLGRLLTENERNSILLPGDITRRIDQALRRNLTPSERAALVEAGIITRNVEQAIETTETVQISRSIDEKIGAQLFVHAALLSEIVRGTYAVAQNTAGLLNRAGGTGMTSYTDPNKAQLYFRFRANANAILQSIFADKPGDGLFGFDDLIAGSGQLFAAGGAFTNGIVRRATSFAMPDGGLGTMGEAGPEAIVPLVQMPNGDLGIQAANPMAGAVAELRRVSAELVAVRAELAELRREQRGQTAVIAESGNRLIAGTSRLVETARETAATQRLATAKPAA